MTFAADKKCAGPLSAEGHRRQIASGSAIDKVSKVDGVAIAPLGLVEDVATLAKSFPEEEDFSLAVAETLIALRHARGGKVDATPLRLRLAGWYSCHYRHKRENGQKADMRLVYRPSNKSIEVKAFGHRHVPSDFYKLIRDGQVDRL